MPEENGMRMPSKLACLPGLFMAALLVIGCSPAEEKNQAVATKKHDHSGWWCTEHGIPEHECSMCLPDDAVQEQFKSKGDWCDKHNRGKSQCFKCDPSLKEKFAAKYRARYGEDPPPIGEEEEEKKGKN
jgi:hypothetical protein